jgi:CubicO group peptidase (beta-lactamase class C family)
MILLVLFASAGCGPSAEDLEAVDYGPIVRDDWDVSTPEELGLDPDLVAELYVDAAELETLYGLLVVKDGRLVAEDYFNQGSIDRQTLVQSVAKSYTSALVGIALDQGCLAGVDQKMVDSFPDFADRMGDPRKHEITIEDMLQMRSGYPNEETDPALWEAVLSDDYVHLVADVPLTADPGAEFQYSNLSTHWLGMIIARGCDTDLESMAQTHLFDPLGAEVGPWRKDSDGYNWAAGELHVTARDAAKFGLLYLDDGRFEGNQVIPADWVSDSLRTYSEDAYGNIGDFHDLGYGYLWWSAEIGDHPVNFAWGHGGQLIVLVDDLDLVVVVTADPFYLDHDGDSWPHEKASFELVGTFIDSL